MNEFNQDHLVRELSILGKGARLSVSARQRVRDNLFKKIGQADLIDAVQTKTDLPSLVMPLDNIISILTPRRVSFGLPATSAMVLGVMLLTFTTGAIAQNAEPGSGIFYTVRRVIEDTQVALIADPVDKANKRIDIASDRIEDTTAKFTVESVSSAESITPVIEATKEAVEDAKKAVNAIVQQDATKDSLTIKAKLQATLELQKEELAKIAEEYSANSEIAAGISTVTEEIDHILATLPAEEEDKEVVEPQDSTGPDATTSAEEELVEPTLVPTQFSGVLVMQAGQYAIFNIEDNQVYILINLLGVSEMSEYLGRGQVTVYGPLTETGVMVRQIFIDSKLVWESPDKNNNNLPRVEGSQN